MTQRALITNGYLSDIASAIKNKNGFSGTYAPFEMASAITNIPTGGGGIPVTQEELNNITSLSGSYSNVGSYAFIQRARLSIVDLPSCTIIGNSAFYYCTGLTSTSFPVCTTIDWAAFYNCTSLSSVDFPVCITIGSSAFAYCRSLTGANFPSCTTIGWTAFQNCTRLTSVSFPSCTSIRSSAFYSCSSLTEVNFPVCTAINGAAFTSCSSLLSFKIGTSNCKLSNANAFQSTPMSLSTYFGYFGSIYVPSEYLSYYLSAVNWSRYSARIVGY